MPKNTARNKTFFALDVETANQKYSSICQIGIVQVEDGVITNTWETYVDPETNFTNTRIHGIDEDTVKGAPLFPEAYEKMLNILGDNPVVTHTHFDVVAIKQSVERYKLPSHNIRFIDSAKMVRRADYRFSQSGYGIQNLCEHYQIPYIDAHNAVGDAKMAAQIVLYILDNFEPTLKEWEKSLKRRAPSRSEIITSETSGVERASKAPEKQSVPAQNSQQQPEPAPQPEAEPKPVKEPEIVKDVQPTPTQEQETPDPLSELEQKMKLFDDEKKAIEESYRAEVKARELIAISKSKLAIAKVSGEELDPDAINDIKKATQDVELAIADYKNKKQRAINAKEARLKAFENQPAPQPMPAQPAQPPQQPTWQSYQQSPAQTYQPPAGQPWHPAPAQYQTPPSKPNLFQKFRRLPTWAKILIILLIIVLLFFGSAFIVAFVQSLAEFIAR